MAKLPAPKFAKVNTAKWVSWQWRTAARALVCLEVLQDAGFRGEDLRQMAATWLAESGGNRHAFNVNAPGKGADLGPAQLNRAWVEMPDDDPRRSWSYSAQQTKQMFGARGFKPWYAHGTQNWVNQFPYVDAAIGCMSPADRQMNGWS